MKLALGISIMCASALIVLYSILIGVLVSGWKTSTNDLWVLSASQTMDTTIQVINSTLNFVEYAAKSVSRFNEHVPIDMLRAFSTMKDQTPKLTSYGFLMYANASHPLKSKLEWQITYDAKCSDYMYLFSNNSINPAFYGYCAQANGTVEYDRLVYSGVDWGLTPLDEALLNGTLSETYVLENSTLTYKTTKNNNPNMEPIVFFSSFDLTQLVLPGISYIYDTTDNRLIWSSKTKNGYIVKRTRFVRPGLDWTIAVSIKDIDVYGNMEHSVVVASCASLGVLASLVLILWVSIHYCVNRQLLAKQKGDHTIPYTMFDELKG